MVGQDIDSWLTFVVYIVVALAATFIGMGALISYFGSKKTRMVGGLFSLVGLIVALVWAYMTYLAESEPWRPVDMLNGILGVVGAGVGAAVGLGLFLFAIIKS